MHSRLSGQAQSIFGQIEITYTDDQVITVNPVDKDSEGSKHVTTYRKVLSTKDKIVTEWEDGGNGEKVSFTMTFVTPDRFWIELTRTPKFNGREYFDRITKAEPIGI